MKSLFVSVAAAIAIAGVTPAIAQTAAAPAAPPPHHHMRAMKPVTRAQLTQMVQKYFARLDADHDGFVTEAEIDAAAQARQQRMAENGGGAGMHHAGFARHLFSMADLNKDGRVSLQEATEAAEQHFDAADTNHDGTVTPDEMRAAHRALRGQHRE